MAVFSSLLPSGALRRQLACAFVLGSFSIACGGNTGTSADAAADGAGDAHGMDAGRVHADSSADASADTMHQDGAADAGQDAAPDTGVDSGTDAGTDTGVPSACAAAVAHIDWTGGGTDCLTTAPTGWAAGLGKTWQAVFESQCEGATSDGSCASEAKKYFECLAKSGGTCNPCVSPNSGECKGSAGVVYSAACGTDETPLAVCACKPSGSSCKKDTDCCAPLTIGVTCLGGSCTY